MGGEREIGLKIKRANIERVLVYHKIYSIYYTGLHLENSSRVVDVIRAYQSKGGKAQNIMLLINKLD